MESVGGEGRGGERFGNGVEGRRKGVEGVGGEGRGREMVGEKVEGKGKGVEGLGGEGRGEERFGKGVEGRGKGMEAVGREGKVWRERENNVKVCKGWGWQGDEEGETREKMGVGEETSRCGGVGGKMKAERGRERREDKVGKWSGRAKE